MPNRIRPPTVPTAPRGLPVHSGSVAGSGYACRWITTIAVRFVVVSPRIGEGVLSAVGDRPRTDWTGSAQGYGTRPGSDRRWPGWTSPGPGMRSADTQRAASTRTSGGKRKPVHAEGSSRGGLTQRTRFRPPPSPTLTIHHRNSAMGSGYRTQHAPGDCVVWHIRAEECWYSRGCAVCTFGEVRDAGCQSCVRLHAVRGVRPRLRPSSQILFLGPHSVPATTLGGAPPRPRGAFSSLTLVLHASDGDPGFGGGRRRIGLVRRWNRTYDVARGEIVAFRCTRVSVFTRLLVSFVVDNQALVPFASRPNGPPPKSSRPTGVARLGFPAEYGFGIGVSRHAAFAAQG